MKCERLLSGSPLPYRMLCLIPLLMLMFVIADAQSTGIITGRAITEDGKGVPQIDVSIYKVGSRPPRTGYAPVVTDEEGNFRFSGLPPSPYRIDVRDAGKYAVRSISGTRKSSGQYFYIGDQITIKLVKGSAITGKIITPNGEPLVSAQVSPIMVRDAEDNPVRQSVPRDWTLADDRGIYRLFGLAPGTYLVFTNGCNFMSYRPYTQLIQTYHPSSTRNTAARVRVTSGGQVTGVDIRFRENLGRVVSGTITGGSESSSPSKPRALSLATGDVSLIDIATGISWGGSSYTTPDGRKGFTFYGVADGEYELVSYGRSKGESLASPPLRVKVKGRDVTGIESKLLPAASISGKIVFEQSPATCQSETMARREEILVSAQRVRVSLIGNDSSGPVLSRFPSGDYSPDDNGQFTIPGLTGGNYYLESVLPDDNWYVKSIITPPATPAQEPAPAPGSISTGVANGLRLEPGDNMTNVTLVVAEGAAGLQGKIVSRRKGSPLPSRLRLYLVPIETSAANDPLRYAETRARSDRTFEFKNLPPGKYWLTASSISGLNQSDPSPLPAVWNPTERTKLRKEAQARKIEIELKPCQRVSDQILRF